MLVISKPDLVDAHKLERVVATVRQLNPEAQLVVAEKGDLPLEAVLDTGLFDEELGEVNPGWVQALNDEPTPETEDTASRRSSTAIAGRSIQSALRKHLRATGRVCCVARAFLVGDPPRRPGNVEPGWSVGDA